MRSRSTVLAALPALILVTSAHAHAADRTNTADIPPRHYDIVSRVESLDGAERTVDQDTKITYGLQAQVLFGKDSATLSDQAQKHLDAIAAKIAASGTTKAVQVNGYTDDLGSAAHGLVLSRDRAEAVRSVLSKNPSLSAVRFTVAGFGEKRPIADNKDESGRVKNRRVEVVVTKG